jgi:sugar lactone lactonase YvrE
VVLLRSGLKTPSGVLALPNGDVLVADFGGGLVARIVNGAVQEPVSMTQPADLAVGADGTVVVVETGAHRVRRLDGKVIAGSGKSGQGKDGMPATFFGLAAPTDVAVAGNRIVIVDRGNDRLVAVDADGTAHVLAAGTTLMSGITGNSRGDVFVSRPQLHQVLRLTSDGTLRPVAALTGVLGLPSGLALGRDGTLYVADAKRKAIITLSPDGTVAALKLGTPLDAPTDVSVQGRTLVVLDGSKIVRFTLP